MLQYKCLKLIYKYMPEIPVEGMQEYNYNPNEGPKGVDQAPEGAADRRVVEDHEPGESSHAFAAPTDLRRSVGRLKRAEVCVREACPVVYH